jgi:serine/threonine protein kinase
MALVAGSWFGAYEILDTLGSGGMGEVYRARVPRLKRDVALKVLPAGIAADPEVRRRFEREAQSVAALNHPNIVTIYSVEESAGVPFLTLEVVQGRTLAELIPEGGFPLERLLGLAVPLADAVSFAHQRGILHRDLKPANVMITTDDNFAQGRRSNTRAVNRRLAVAPTRPACPVHWSLAGPVPFTGRGLSRSQYVIVQKPSGRACSVRCH